MWTIMMGACLVCWVLAHFQLDAWPFTRYPMFSGRTPPEDARVVRIRLILHDGTSQWWAPRSHRYADAIGSRLQNPEPGMVLWAAAEVLRLIAHDEGGTGRYRAISIVERRWENGSVRDRELSSIPVPRPTVPRPK